MARSDYPQQAFHVMAKPTGAACNLHCAYCFYREKARLYPGSDFRMSDAVHEAYIRQLFASHSGRVVTVAWQGGEPTLMGLDFFRRSIELQKKYAVPGVHVENSFQTNGVLLDKEWCRFFRQNNFLVGLSMDGPGELHDFHRKDGVGNGTFDRVLKAVRLLQQSRVDFNILCTVNSKNAENPLGVYRFFRDEIRARYIQFIPIVEREDESGCRPGGSVTDRSVRPEQFGGFLIDIFDEWVRRDVGGVFVTNFDGALAGWLGIAGTVCIFAPACGVALALEHNGDLYSCDHFVTPAHLLGNIMRTPLIDLVTSERQRAFGQNKESLLPRYCRECEFARICNGECPRNRFARTPDGRPGLNYLCAGYKAFFAHADGPMRIMADLIRNRRPAAGVMNVLAGDGRSNMPPK